MSGSDDQTEEAPATDLEVTRQSIDHIREDLRSYGTALGALAGAISLATVLVKFDDLFPLTADLRSWWWWWCWLGVCVVVACGSLVGLTAIFFWARRRIVVDTLKPDGLEPEVRQALTHWARGEGGADHLVVEARAARLARVAARAERAGQTEVAEAAANESRRLFAGEQLAIAEGALLLVEGRSIKAYRWAPCVAAVAAVSIAALYLTIDYTKGQRDQVSDFNACVKDAAAQAEAVSKVYADFVASTCAGLRPTSRTTYDPWVLAPVEDDAPDVIGDLATCASRASELASALPRYLTRRAIAACAGLPDPPSAASATPAATS